MLGETNGVTPPADPAHPAPHDPLIGGDTRALTKLIYRQVPVVTIQHGWEVGQVRNALRHHSDGQFEMSGQLVDSILGDDRVQATIGSRSSGLFGRPVRFKAANKTREARDCLKAWKEAWPKFATTAALVSKHTHSIMMGFSPAQLLWDTTGPVWRPVIEPWHPRFTYYNWADFRYHAISSDGDIPIEPGNGKWVLHAPWGAGVNARAWIRGAIRPVAEPWIFRHWAIRDLARYTEVHGMPIRKGIVPAASDQVARDLFASQIANLGQETSLMVQKGVDGTGQDFDLDLVEAKDTSWEAMIGLRDHCDMAIVLAILFQNLTTEVKGGSFAATTAHMDIRSSGIQADNESWRLTIYEQIARPFAFLNFGDADLAPWTDWEVEPLSDWDARCSMLSKFGSGVEVLRRGGVQFKDEEDFRRFAREMGIKLPRIKFVDPPGIGGSASGTRNEKALDPNG